MYDNEPDSTPSTDSTRSPVSSSARSVDITGRPAPQDASAINNAAPRGADAWCSRLKRASGPAPNFLLGVTMWMPCSGAGERLLGGKVGLGLGRVELGKIGLFGLVWEGLVVTNSDLSSSASLVWMLGWPYPDLLAGITGLRPSWGQTEYRREARPYSL
eukprot:352642-Chlamydomonas_euryale.AAC.6